MFYHDKLLKEIEKCINNLKELPIPKTNTFEKEINKVLSKLDNVPYINNGGCAISALALEKHINALYPEVKTQIVYLFGSWEKDRINDINNGNARSCSHAYLRINNIYYDSHGGFTLKELEEEWRYPKLLNVSNKIVIDSINHSDWNPCFDRKDISKICSILNIERKKLQIA